MGRNNQIKSNQTNNMDPDQTCEDEVHVDPAWTDIKVDCQ